MSKIGLKSHKLAYLAGLLDGDGSIYIRLKKRDDCRYGYQISPYVVFFQSSKYKKQFSEIFNDFNFGYLRERNDGMLEYVINRHSDIYKFLNNISPFLFLKQKQAQIMIEIIDKKRNISNQKDFNKLVRLKEILQNLNYSTNKI